MLSNQFKNIISTVTNNSSGSGNLDGIHRLICYYFKNIYNGTELPMVIEKFYYDRLFVEIMVVIGKSEQYAEFNEKNIQKFSNLITKTITKSKINSLRVRQKMYWTWLGGESNYFGYNKILAYLWKCYTIKDKLEVKKLLGLDGKLLD